MLGLYFSVLFPPSLAAGSSLRAAASPCGRSRILLLQLSDQLERIHNACLYQQSNKVEIIRSLLPTSISIKVLHNNCVSSKMIVGTWKSL